MKKYVILFIVFLLAATATIIAGKKVKQNNRFQYSALGVTFQCSVTKDQRWTCELPQDNPRNGRLTMLGWKITKKEQDKKTLDPANPKGTTILDGNALTIAQGRKQVIDTFTTLFGEPIKDNTFICPQEETIAGYARALYSTVEIEDRDNLREIKIPIPSAEVFYKITPEKVVVIINQFLRSPDMLEHPEKITLQKLQSLWNKNISSEICELP